MKDMYGFEVKKSEYIKDIDSNIYLFYHKKTNAKLIFVSNDDKNKVFFTSFKTPPENNKGIAHIMEHSVLCGSKKYKVKEPFNELMKGSLNTYLNAITYSDKTIYPVASTNDKDFENLFKVYIDAVFNPLIYEKKEIFLQEGWRYEFNEDLSKLNYTGIVYNEMKGAFSDHERILSNAISKSLFMTSPYRFESGGIPEDITDLSYEEFLDFHKKYYHPSNSYIYFYGNINIEKYLKYIDEEYLSQYDKIEFNNNILLEKEFIYDNYYEDTYSTQSDDDGTYIAFNFVLCNSNEVLKTNSINILSYILFENEDSIIKRKIVDSGIAEDVESWYDTSTYQTVLTVVGKNCDLNRKKEFKDIILYELNNIVKNGIDKDIIKASLNVVEFHICEENYGYKPKGLVYGLKLMKGLLYGYENFDLLEDKECINKIRNFTKNNYFEKLIEDIILNNKHTSLVVIKPEIGKQLKLDKEIEKKLENILLNMTEYEKNLIIKESKLLTEYQNRKEKNEDLESIPIIELDEIDKNIDKIEGNIVNTKNSILYFTPYNTNNIVYTQMSFNTSCVPKYLINYIGLLSDLMSKMGTKKYSFRKLPNQINMYTGEVSFSFDIYSRTKDNYIPSLTLNAKALFKNVDKLFEIIEEIVFNTIFDSKEEFKNILKVERLNLEDKILNNAHSVSSIKALSHFAENYAYNDNTSGINYYNFLCKIEEELELNFEQIIENIKNTYKYIFNKNNLICALTTQNEYLNDFISYFDKFVSLLPDKNYDKINYDFDCSIKSEAIITSGKVVYDAKAFNYSDLGYKYSGHMNVLRTIINLEYLWTNIRIKGGAYGAGCQISRNGNIYCYSYRDPNLLGTLNIFDNISKFIYELNINDREMRKYIIGTINNYDKPKSALEIAEISFSMYMCNITNELIQKERLEILSTNIDIIKKYCKMFEFIKCNGSICVIGNENKIEENKDIFQKIEKI